jgi:hypothetical protein
MRASSSTRRGVETTLVCDNDRRDLIHTSRKECLQVTSAPVPNHYWPQMDELWDKSKDVKQRLSMRPAAVSRIRRILSADFIVAPTRKLDPGGVAMPRLTPLFRVHTCGVNCSEPIVSLPSLLVIVGFTNPYRRPFGVCPSSFIPRLIERLSIL